MFAARWVCVGLSVGRRRGRGVLDEGFGLSGHACVFFGAFGAILPLLAGRWMCVCAWELEMRGVEIEVRGGRCRVCIFALCVVSLVLWGGKEGDGPISGYAFMSVRVGLRPECEAAKVVSQALSSVRRFVDCVRVVVAVIGEGRDIVDGRAVCGCVLVSSLLSEGLRETRGNALDTRSPCRCISSSTGQLFLIIQPLKTM